MQVIIPLLIWGYVLSLLIEPYLPLSWIKEYPNISVYLSYSLIALVWFYFYFLRPMLREINGTKRITFGKYKFRKWENLPTEYLEWVTDNYDDFNDASASRELERRKLKKKQSNHRIGTIYDQDGNVSTDEVMNAQLRKSIKDYDNNVTSKDPSQEHLNKIKQSKSTTIFSTEGFYFDGQFISNKEMEEQEEREKFYKEQEELK